MTQPMPADVLREAAKRIREHAQGARPWPWISPRSVPNPSVRTERGSEIAWMTYADDQATADYMALMHPGVALAVAEVLEKAAADIVDNPDVYVEGTRAEDWYAAELALARLVLGERSK